MPRTRIKRENLQTAIPPKLCKSEIWVLGTALPHNEIYPYMKFQVHIFSTFRVMPRKRIKRENLQKAITPKLCKSEFQVHVSSTLRVMPRTRIKRENVQRAITPKLCKAELRFLCTALRLTVI